MKAAVFIVLTIVSWEGFEYVFTELRIAIRGECDGEQIPLWSFLDCRQYQAATEALNREGFLWEPGRRGTVCVSYSDRADIITALAENGGIPDPDSDATRLCPLP